MADKLPPVVIELKLEIEQMQQQLRAVTSQMESMGNNASSAVEPVNLLGGAFKAVGGAIAGVLAAAEVIKFLNESAQAAVTSGKSFNLMALQMKNSTGATHEQSKAIDGQLEKMSLATGTLMPSLRDNFSKLVRVTNDSAQALKLESLAQNISAATGKDLGVVSIALARAHEGNWMAINKLMPGVKEATDKFGYLEKATRGAAEEAAKSDPYARMQAAMEAIQVSIGQAFLPVLQSLADALANIAPKVTEMMNAFVASPQFQSFIDALPGVVDFMGQLADQIFPVLADLGGIVGSAFDIISGDVKSMGDNSGSVVTLFTTIRGFFDWLNQAISGLTVWQKNFNDFLDSWKNLGPVSAAVVGFVQQMLDPIGSLMKSLTDLGKLLGWVKDKNPFETSTASGSNSRWDFRKAAPKLPGGGGGGGGGGGNGNAQADALAAALAKFHTAVTALQGKFNTDSQNLLTQHLDQVAKIVAAKKGELTEAFKQATQVDAGSLLSQVGGSITNLISSLKDKLSGAKKLSEDAGKLAGLGYSQEFVQQIVAQGPQVGDQLSQQLLSATPEQAQQIQNLMGQVKTVSTTGVNTLADFYVSQQSFLVNALKDENEAYAKSAEDLQKKFDVAMAKLQVSRDQAAIKALKMGGVTAAEQTKINAYKRDITAENKIISAGGTTINTTLYATTNATPDAILSTVVSGLKFNAPVVLR